MKRATFTNAKDYVSAKEISIHTLCEEGDADEGQCSAIFFDISIHTLCEEGDVSNYPRLSVRKYISIHTLCEEGDVKNSKKETVAVVISIHTLCEEGDRLPSTTILSPLSFQSTPSVKRATITVIYNKDNSVISIHTLCEEGDYTC